MFTVQELGAKTIAETFPTLAGAMNWGRIHYKGFGIWKDGRLFHTHFKG